MQKTPSDRKQAVFLSLMMSYGIYKIQDDPVWAHAVLLGAFVFLKAVVFMRGEYRCFLRHIAHSIHIPVVALDEINKMY